MGKKIKQNLTSTAKFPKKKLQGKVISNKMQKTIVVEIKRIKQHPLYKKRYCLTQKIKVHDQDEKAKIGDLVEIKACRPLSKEKHFCLVKIIKK